MGENPLRKELKSATQKRSIIEQVDNFIEGIAEGSILFLTSKLLTTSMGIINRDMGLDSERIKSYGEMRREIINDLIPRYKQSKGREKTSIANEIYSKMLWGRSIGLIYNDPNFLKELNWYRIQNERLNRENEKLHAYVKDLTKIIIDSGKLGDMK
jgi:hypothetical protein